MPGHGRVPLTKLVGTNRKTKEEMGKCHPSRKHLSEESLKIGNMV